MKHYNRLNLDFSLNSIEERSDFIKTYLQNFNGENFNGENSNGENLENSNGKSLTNEELETCANYILWGKQADGKNAVQKKELQIETRHKTWVDSISNPGSLDGLIEDPRFSENLILYPEETPLKNVKVTFNREKELARAPSRLKIELLDLFYQIDRIEILTNFYEIQTGKRKKPPRKKLLDAFSEEELLSFELQAQRLTQFKYLKLRHLLVELRRQQYGIKDLYAQPLIRDLSGLPPRVRPENSFTFGADIEVFPLGIKTARLPIFQKGLKPKDLSQDQLKEISKLVWERKRKKEEFLKEEKNFFDFSNPQHLKFLVKFYYDLEDQALRQELHNTTQQFLETFNFYVSISNLTPIQLKVLELKKKGFKNRESVKIINREFGKKYRQNYIATIYNRQVLKALSRTVQLYTQFIENIFFIENFKTCSCCGGTFLRTKDFFTKKKTSQDGLSARCKRCDRLKRQGLLEKGEGKD